MTLQGSAARIRLRDDAHTYINAEQKRGVKTGTIRRYINTIHAVIGTWLREKEIDRTNPFTRIAIPANGEDAKKRQPFTGDELKTLFTECKAKDDDVRWLIAILADTGARMAEITGLAMSDLVLDAETPHVVIQPHPWRSLKNAASARAIPLMGHALWAAQRVTETASKGQRFVFPRYTSAAGTKATHASNTVAKWIRGLETHGERLEHTAHDLRHTMADRLEDRPCLPRSSTACSLMLFGVASGLPRMSAHSASVSRFRCSILRFAVSTSSVPRLIFTSLAEYRTCKSFGIAR